jgi:hypothetical protein
MKNLVLPLLAGLVLSCADSGTHAQEFKENTTKEFLLPQSTGAEILAIYNIFGSVKVEGYDGNKVVFEVRKTIKADNDTQLELGKKEFRFEIIQQHDSIIAYISEPFDSRPNRNVNRHDNREIEYGFQLDFVVKVPYEMSINVSTVDKGDINVGNVTGNLRVQNVNGSVNMDRVKGTTDAGTVNGDLIISYLSNPTEESSYRTINGDIKISCPSDLSADMQFKSMQGEFYTDFSDTEMLPGTIKKNKENEGKGTMYKLEKTTTVRFGSGGRLFKFETINGSVFIKKQS